ncbi:MAG: polyprenol monophosphomannose synthase [Pseudolysinimonas sp.]|uniref:polyprenol monophosphomannose synthase n=1 Tax=Pseudolysinimonas sp. TaxID=2680009 RepID=UPI0032647938
MPNDATLPRVLVIIPTYDEAESLEAIVAAVLLASPDADVLVVDDASPDGTGEIADRLASADPRVTVLHRTGKDGLGRAYVAGFRVALERGYDLVVELDADGSHPPSALPALLAAVRADPGVGLSIGSRWVPGGTLVDWPMSRRILSRAANSYARKMLRLGVRDVTAGYRVYRADALRGFALDEIDSRGYCFQIDMTVRTADAGWAITELPIEFRERTAGRSKMSWAIVAEAMLRVTGWGVARLFRPRPTAQRQAQSAVGTSPAAPR